MGTEVRETPLRDLYKILWCFERIRAAEYAHLLDPALSTEILGNHAVWWDHQCARIPADWTRYRKNLTDLAAHFLARDRSLVAWARADFTSPEALPAQPQQA